MEGYVCAVGGAKGGVGKTTVAVNLGAALAAEGVDAVVVDADLRMSNLSTLLSGQVLGLALVSPEGVGASLPATALILSAIIFVSGGLVYLALLPLPGGSRGT